MRINDHPECTSIFSLYFVVSLFLAIFDLSLRETLTNTHTTMKAATENVLSFICDKGSEKKAATWFSKMLTELEYTGVAVFELREGWTVNVNEYVLDMAALRQLDAVCAWHHVEAEILRHEFGFHITFISE
jgi:hypothetical protein